MEQLIRIGVDTSKTVFQLHGVDAQEKIIRRQVKRKEFLKFFKDLPPTYVGMEACGGSHHWARSLQEMGHRVVLIAPQNVKPYIRPGRKNDAADAAGICEAMSRPTMKFVPIKTAEQQAGLMLLTLRDRLIRDRTATSNQIRSHAAEFGLATGLGFKKLEELVGEIAAASGVPALAKALIAELAQELVQIETRLAPIERELLAWQRANKDCRRLERIGGVGPLGSAMLVMKTPDPQVFASARHYASWLGLTPKDHSTAGKQRLGGITRAGDEALRSTLMLGAMALVTQVRRGRTYSPWILALLARGKAPKQVAIAVANKMARIAWKMLVTGQEYDPKRSSIAGVSAIAS